MRRTLLPSLLLLLGSCSSIVGTTAPELRLVSGASGSGAAGSVLPDPLVVEVRNHHEPTANTTVRFTGLSAGGTTSGERTALAGSSATGEFAASMDVRTDSQGKAHVWIKLGSTPGTARVVALAAGLGVEDTVRYSITP